MKLKILVIEDEECIRESLTWFLQDLGHEVSSAAAPKLCNVYCGHSCNNEVACGDVLLIDYIMPGMNGLDFISRLKERGCKGVVANMLLMSGNIAAIDASKAAELGCEIVQKPLSFAQLEAWLDGVIERISSRCRVFDQASQNARTTGSGNLSREQ